MSPCRSGSPTEKRNIPNHFSSLVSLVKKYLIAKDRKEESFGHDANDIVSRLSTCEATPPLFLAHLHPMPRKEMLACSSENCHARRFERGIAKLRAIKIYLDCAIVILMLHVPNSIPFRFITTHAPSQISCSCTDIQRSPLLCTPGLVKFVPAVARLFCLALPWSFLTMF